MGIRGLTGYLKKDEVSLAWDRGFLLRNTRLVVDGSALLYELLDSCGPAGQLGDIRCGGQYLDFYRSARNFFSELTKHGVRPLLVLDGISPEEKLETATQRYSQLAQFHKELAECSLEQGEVSTGRHSVYPVWAPLVFMEAIVDSDVAVVRAEWEADDIIALLARHWNCPVLSADSDFFIYDLPAGFLHIKRIDCHHPCTNGAVPLFRRSRLVSTLAKMSPLKGYSEEAIGDVLPLAACLLGNDYVPLQDVQRLYGGEGVSSLLVRPLLWLLKTLRVQGVEDGLRQLSGLVSESVHSALQYSVKMYSPEGEQLRLAAVHCLSPEYFASPLSQTARDDDTVPADPGTPASYPARFMEAFHSAVQYSVKVCSAEAERFRRSAAQCMSADYSTESLSQTASTSDGDSGAAATATSAHQACPSWLMDAYHLGLVQPGLLAGCICSFSKVDLHLDSIRHAPVSNVDRPLRSVMLALVASPSASVMELVRTSGTVAVQKVRLKADDSVPGFEAVARMHGEEQPHNIAQSRTFLLCCCGSLNPRVQSLPLGFQLVVGSLRYTWTQLCLQRSHGSAVPATSERHFKVLLVGVLNGCRGNATRLCKDAGSVVEMLKERVASWCEDEDGRHRNNSKRNVSSDRVGDGDSDTNDDDDGGACVSGAAPLPSKCYIGHVSADVIHVFNAWQRSLTAVMQLNAALHYPYPQLHVHRLYDGVRSYTLYSDRREGEPLRATEHRQLAQDLWRGVVDDLDCCKLPAPSSKKSKKAKQQKPQKQVAMASKAACSEAAAETGSKKSGAGLPGNRFAALGLDEMDG